MNCLGGLSGFGFRKLGQRLKQKTFNIDVHIQTFNLDVQALRVGNLSDPLTSWTGS